MVAYSLLHPAFIPSPLSCRQIRPPAFHYCLPPASQPPVSSLLPPAFLPFIHSPLSRHCTRCCLPPPLPASCHRLLPLVVPNLTSRPSILHPQSLPSFSSLLSCRISPLSRHHASCRLPPPTIPNQPSCLLTLHSLIIPPISPLPSLPSLVSRCPSPPPPRHHAQLSPLHPAAPNPSSRRSPSYFHPPALPPISPLFSLPTNPTPLPPSSPMCPLPSPSTSNPSSRLPSSQICHLASHRCLPPPAITSCVPGSIFPLPTSQPPSLVSPFSSLPIKQPPLPSLLPSWPPPPPPPAFIPSSPCSPSSPTTAKSILP